MERNKNRPKNYNVKSADERFDARFEKRGADECWNWIFKFKERHGYPHFYCVEHGRAPASHYALRREGRPRPHGLFACHHCDNPLCVNPAHLYWGAQVENIADAVERKRFKGRPKGFVVSEETRRKASETKTGRPRPLNPAGLRGVFRQSNGRYRANITVSGVTVHLGVFDSAEDAHQAYLDYKRNRKRAPIERPLVSLL